ncbi:MAG: 4Fe-4S double cluster binding domain-containing protein [Candidatus Hodarchaeota archaeon]
MDRQELFAGHTRDRSESPLGYCAYQCSIAGNREPIDERCGTCQQCVEVCPPKAFTGKPFREEEPRDVRFAAHECKRYFARIKESIGLAVCGLCLYVCPFGRKDEANPKQKGGRPYLQMPGD